MECPTLADQERILRAITTADWDEQHGRIRRSLFVDDAGVSVSRLSVFSLPLICEIFHRDLDKPTKTVTHAGEITVGAIKAIGTQHQDKPLNIAVVEKPLCDNEAHAEIVTKITRGISKKIVDKLKPHISPGPYTRWAGSLGNRFLVWFWRKAELIIFRAC